MSIEIFVLSDRRLNSIQEWQSAIDNEGFNLKLDRSRPIAELRGYLPAKCKGSEAGFECDHFDAAEIMEETPDIDFDRPWKQCLAFRFGGDFMALWGATAAAAAYARATDGVVYDGESGEILAPERAVKQARDLEKSIPEMLALVNRLAAPK